MQAEITRIYLFLTFKWRCHGLMASITPEYASVLRNVWVNCTASTHGLLFRDLGLDFDHSLGGLHTRYDAKEMFGML